MATKLLIATITLLIPTLTACVAGDKDLEDSGEFDDFIAIADAPEPLIAMSIHDDSGALIQEWAVGEGDPLQANEANGVLNIVGQHSGTTQLMITLWEDIEVGGSWSVQAFDEDSLPSQASVTFVEPGNGGMATGGALTIDAWQATDSPYIMLISGTFEAGPVVNEGDATWIRDLRNGSFEYLKVTVP